MKREYILPWLAVIMFLATLIYECVNFGEKHNTTYTLIGFFGTMFIFLVCMASIGSTGKLPFQKYWPGEVD